MATKHQTIIDALKIAAIEANPSDRVGYKWWEAEGTAPESAEKLRLVWYARGNGTAVAARIYDSKGGEVGIPGVETRAGRKVRVPKLFAPQAAQVARHFARLVTRKVFVINGDAAIVLWRDDRNKLAPKITVYGKYGDNGTIRHVRDKATIARYWDVVHSGTTPANVLWDWIEEHDLAEMPKQKTVSA